MAQLEIDGDQFEQDFWPKFIKNKFPSYENFWLKYTFPLKESGRINFKNDPNPVLEKIPLNIHIAQLNYGIIRNLIRCFQILESLKSTRDFIQYDLFIEGVTRLVGALDNGDEILARFKWPDDSGELPTETIESEARRLRKKWRDSINDPLQKIRNYRNRIIHSSPPPQILNDDENKSICLPEVGKENLYVDFRLVSNYSPQLEQYKKDFIPVLRILEGMWEETIKYLEENWKKLGS